MCDRQPSVTDAILRLLPHVMTIMCAIARSEECGWVCKVSFTRSRGFMKRWSGSGTAAASLRGRGGGEEGTGKPPSPGEGVMVHGEWCSTPGGMLCPERHQLVLRRQISLCHWHWCRQLQARTARPPSLTLHLSDKRVGTTPV